MCLECALRVGEADIFDYHCEEEDADEEDADEEDDEDEEDEEDEEDDDEEEEFFLLLRWDRLVADGGLSLSLPFGAREGIPICQR